jgi:hypothetical protein
MLRLKLKKMRKRLTAPRAKSAEDKKTQRRD